MVSHWGAVGVRLGSPFWRAIWHNLVKLALHIPLRSRNLTTVYIAQRNIQKQRWAELEWNHDEIMMEHKRMFSIL